MIERVCLIQEPPEVAIAGLYAELPAITADEWVQLKACCLLRPVLQVIEELSAEKNVTASNVLPMIRGLVSTVKKR